MPALAMNTSHLPTPDAALQLSTFLRRPFRAFHALPPQKRIIQCASSRSSIDKGAAASILDALSQGAASLQRLATPLPPGFPSGPAGDVALDLLRDPLAFLAATQSRYGDVVGLSLGGRRVVLVTDPSTAKAVLIDNPEIYVKAGTAFFPGSSLAGNGLLVSDGDIWRRQRQLATPAFRRKAVERYGESMVDCTASTLRGKRWREGAVRDVYADFNELTLRITLTALFGADMDSSAAREVTDSIKTAFEFFSRRAATAFAIPEAVPTPDNLQFTAAVKRLDGAVYGLIAQRREQLATINNNTIDEESKGGDLLGALLAARDDQGNAMEDRALRDELMTLLVAGQETSAIVLGWTCALLAEYPEEQEAVAEEIAATLGGRAPTPSDARGAFPRLEAVVLESLRVLPPAYLVGRCASRATKLSGYDLPAGTTVLVSPYMLHRDQRWWGQDAALFYPDRWLPAATPEHHTLSEGGNRNQENGNHTSKEKKVDIMSVALSGMGPHGAYIPFGAGQRNCIGAGFALMEAVLVLAAVLSRFQLVALPGAGMPKADPKITLRPSEVRLILRNRKRRVKSGSRVQSDAGAAGNTVSERV